MTLDRYPDEVRAEVARTREVVARLHAELPRWGLVVWTAGNVSQRVRVPGGEDLLVIKPSGVTYDELTAQGLMTHALDAKDVAAESHHAVDQQPVEVEDDLQPDQRAAMLERHVAS